MQSKSKILVIDDQLAPRESVRLVLKDKYDVMTASGAVEAFEYMAKNRVNLVLLDIKMPKIDGVKALKEIKERYPETEVILLTAYANLEITTKALKIGAFGYIMKPFDKDELLETIDKALKNKSS